MIEETICNLLLQELQQQEEENTRSGNADVHDPETNANRDDPHYLPYIVDKRPLRRRLTPVVWYEGVWVHI